MNLYTKKEELLNLIIKYLDNQCSTQNLQEFAWEIIDYFSTKKKLPPYQDFENEFWYTIWQIQHLADEEHEKEGITRKALIEALAYLQNKKKLPNNYKGTRPLEY